MTTSDLIGYIAALFTSFMMLPQILMTLRTKNVAHLSGVMIVLYTASCIIWIAYGLMIHALPVIMCNLIAASMGIVQIFLKIRYN